MKQVAFKMKIKAGYAEEYQRRHDAIWPKLQAVLTAAGIYDYAIYLDEPTLTLFAVQKLKPDNTASDLPQHPVVREWWDYMADIMEVNFDNSPVVADLREVFYLA
jgi:L-rhamnose mutarotase